MERIVSLAMSSPLNAVSMFSMILSFEVFSLWVASYSSHSPETAL